MLKLDNGITFFIERNNEDAFCLTIDGYGGAIKDCELKNLGICHLFEHLAFKEMNSNLYVNGATTETVMSFMMSPLNTQKKKDNSLLNYISKFFFLDNNYSKLNLITLDDNDDYILQSRIQEIANECIYRKSMVGSQSNIIFLNNNGIGFNFCGNEKTFANLNVVKKNLMNLNNNIPTNMISIFLNKNILSNKEIELLINMFKQVTPNYLTKRISFPDFKYFGKSIAHNDLEYYVLTFKLNITLEEAMLFHKAIRYLKISASKMMNEVIFQFIFVYNQHVSDFIFLLMQKNYSELIKASKTCSYEFKEFKEYYYFEYVNFLNYDIEYIINNYQMTIFKVFDILHNKIINNNFVIFQLKDNNSYTMKTFLDEEVIIADYQLNKEHFYLKTLPIELEELFPTNDVLYNNKKYICNNTSIYELNLDNCVNKFNYGYSQTGFYQNLFLYFFTSPNLTKNLLSENLIFDRTNIPIFIKSVLNNLENDNLELDIAFQNKTFNITTNYNFFNIIFKIKSELKMEFYNKLPFMIDNAKHKGIFYYLSIQKQSYKNFTYISLFSIINHYDKIKIIIPNIINELMDLYCDKITIISKKGTEFEWPIMMKNISLKF